MNKELRLVALDLDGTLVGHGGERATEATVTAIKKAQQQGIEVVISTGRHRSTSLPIAEQLGVNYMITLNGGEIWTKDGELLKRQAIDQPTVEKIIEIHKQHQTYYWLVSHEKVYREALPDNYLAHQWIKFGFDVEDDTIRAAMQEQFTQLPTIELSNSSLTNIELNAKGTHKASAIDFLLQQLNLDFSQVMAVGDSINDLKMIEAAAVGVAMGNAQALVKERADWVTAELDQDGAAQAIEHFILS